MRIEHELLLKHYKHKPSKEVYIEEGSPYLEDDYKGWNYLFKCSICGIELIDRKNTKKAIDGYFVWRGSETDFTLPTKKIRQELINCGMYATGGTS